MKKNYGVMALSILVMLTGCNDSGGNTTSTTENDPETIKLEDKGLYESTTYLKCYGMVDELKDGFINRSDLIKASWGYNEYDEYVKLGGRWNKSGLTNRTSENYFVVEYIDGEAVEASDVRGILTNACSRGIQRRDYDGNYSNIIRYNASNGNIRDDYPILTETEVKTIAPSFDDALDYGKILRYAYASKYSYSTEVGVGAFPYLEDNVAKEIFLIDNEVKEVARVTPDHANTETKLHAVAIEVPAIPEKGFEKEIIIAYKGSSNVSDFVEDARLGARNLYESTEHTKWLEEAYAFYTKVTKEYPACKSSYDISFQEGKPESDCYNVVITGHSLGAFLAVDVGTRTGISTRAFSTPSTRVIESYRTALSNQMRLNNVITFYRKGDPVTIGNHIENMIQLVPPVGFKKSPAGSHFLMPFIDEVLRAKYMKTSGATPLSIELTPNAMLGTGLNKVINSWGEPLYENSVNPKKYNLTTADELDSSKVSEIFTYFKENAIEGNFTGVDNANIRYVKFENPNEEAALVVVNGRTETYLKYAEFVYDILKTNNLNYSIYLLDHRSQGFSDRLVVDNPSDCYGDKNPKNREECQKHHLNSFDNMVTDLNTFITDVVKPETHSKLLVYGHSMGGGLTTRYIEAYPTVFDAAFLSAPMHQIAQANNFDLALLNTGLFTSDKEKSQSYLFLGPVQKSEPWAEPVTDKEKDTAFAGDHTTSRPRWDMVLGMWKNNPQVQLGGTTYGWLKTSLEATENMLTDVNNIKIPVKIIQASEDTAVGLHGQNEICTKLMENNVNCELVVNRGSKHEGMVEQDSYRGFFMTHFLDFMNKYSQ